LSYVLEVGVPMESETAPATGLSLLEKVAKALGKELIVNEQRHRCLTLRQSKQMLELNKLDNWIIPSQEVET